MVESKKVQTEENIIQSQSSNPQKTRQLLDPKNVAKTSLDLAIEMLNLSMGLVVIVQEDALPIFWRRIIFHQRGKKPSLL